MIMKNGTIIKIFLTYIIFNSKAVFAQSIDSIISYPIKIGYKEKDLLIQLKNDSTLRASSSRKNSIYVVYNRVIDSIQTDSIQFMLYKKSLEYIYVYYPCKYKGDINTLVKINDWKSNSEGRYNISIITKIHSIDKYCIIAINTFDSLEYAPCKLIIYNLKDRYSKKEIKKIMKRRIENTSN